MTNSMDADRDTETMSNSNCN